MYFYPAASTPGCTKQACDFRDSLAELNGAGLEVVGISPDKPAKLAKFRDNEELTFPLLSDPEKATLEAWGAFGEKKMYGKTVTGRHPLDVPGRRGRQDRGGPVQRPRHRPRRQATPRPIRLTPVPLRNSASAKARFSISDGSTLSSGAWMRHCGSSTPINTISASGNCLAPTHCTAEWIRPGRPTPLRGRRHRSARLQRRESRAVRQARER